LKENKMKHNLPTRERCQEIVKSSEAFFCMEKVIEGQNVELYDYRLASISDFVNNDAFELRGLCFVEQSDGTWKRHILLNKFFNVNQTIGWMYDEVKDKKIQRVQNKEDGSIISFIKFQNGKVLAKSKMSFESTQAVMAQKLFLKDDDNIREFIDDMISENKTPIFEVVGPDNQIVLEYHNTELILLQVRDNITGEYVNGDELEYYTGNYGVQRAITFSSKFNNLDFLLKQKETSQEPIEGWVITFEDGQMAKIKTDKYLQLHGLIGPDAFRENLLVSTILDKNIDDVISALVPGPKKDRIIALDETVTKHFNHLIINLYSLEAEYYHFHNENRKEFAIKWNKHPLFGTYMKIHKNPVTEDIAEKAVKEHIEKQCNGLNKAIKYLEVL